MKVLWFEITVPGRYKENGIPVGGWQDSLEEIVRHHTDIKLYIAFEGREGYKRKSVSGVHYIPINPHYNLVDRLINRWTFKHSSKRLIPLAVKVIEEVKPDIIHVFGSEWCWGQVQLFTDIPVVIHMQGSIPSYYNAQYPPGYSLRDIYHHQGYNILSRFKVYLKSCKLKSWVQQEEKTLQCVSNYMGRTEWDHNIVKFYNPNAKYFYCAEALRPSFMESSDKWRQNDSKIMKIITIGVSSLWKGLDTILRTARLLKQKGYNFEWICAGTMDRDYKTLVENKEHTTFKENNVIITGFIDSELVKKYLLSSDLYVHTAYIDNSPNSICEAQFLGLPIIATYVGGIPSLIDHNKDGLLIPANDPCTLAMNIIKLYSDKNRCVELGHMASEKALLRHNVNAIYKDILACYNAIKNIQQTDN